MGRDGPNTRGQVYFVTGGNTGVGKEVVRILYSKNAKVYVGCRSEEKAHGAFGDIKKAHPDSQGSLTYIHLDLSDLSTIKATADAFTAQETTLHVLFNNAGVSMPMSGADTLTAQGYEIHLGTNTLGPFLLTKLLTPTLIATAAAASRASPTGNDAPVRVVWVSSSAAENHAHRPGGVPVDLLLASHGVDRAQYARSVPTTGYGNSKAGSLYHAREYARRHRDQGVVSVAVNPGSLRSDLLRHMDASWALAAYRRWAELFCYPAVYGAYAELWAGVGEEVTMEATGAWGELFSLSSFPLPSIPL